MADFDWIFYVNYNTDLSTIKSEEEALEHYNTHGFKEKRICSKEKYKNFDWKFYLYVYDDLKDIRSEIEALRHYINYGIQEERYANVEPFYNVDWNAYIKEDDLIHIKTKKEAIKHYINIGKKENKILKKKINNKTTRLNDSADESGQNTTIYQDNDVDQITEINNLRKLMENIDWNVYIRENIDLTNIKSKEEAIKYFINYCIERNIIKSNIVSGWKYYIDYNDFDWKFYSSYYHDLSQLNFTDKDSAFSHYFNYGKQENRIYNIDFLNDYNTFNHSIYNSLYDLQDLSKKDSYNHWIQNRYNITNNRNKLIEIDNNKTFITFIIPTLGRHSLKEAVTSLLNLNNKNWKLIIVFDGVKNNLNIIDDRIKIIEANQKNSAGLVRNIGFKFVENSDWVGFLDDDDYLSPDYIDNLKKEIELNSRISVCLFRMKYLDGTILPTNYDSNIIKNSCGISFAIKKDVIKNIKFKEEYAEDYLFLKEAEYKGYIIAISEYVTYFVRNPPTYSDSFKRYYVNFYKELIDEYLTIKKSQVIIFNDELDKDNNTSFEKEYDLNILNDNHNIE